MGVEERLARIEGILEQMDRRINGLVHRMNRLEERLGRLEDRVFSLFRWTVGLIVAMWVTVMCTLIPILLRLLGAM